MAEEQIFDVGGIQLRVDHRTFGDDGGPAVRVFGDVGGEQVQVLRFDCFRKEPHYHYDPSGKDDKRDLDKDSVPDPISWTLEQLRHNLPEMVRTAGYGNLAQRIDVGAVKGTLCEVEDIMRTK